MRYFILCLLSLFFIGTVRADGSRTPFETELSGDFAKLAALSREYFVADRAVNPISEALYFHGNLPTVGQVSLHLDEVRAKSWDAFKEEGGKLVRDNSKILLFRGTARLPGNKQSRVSASLFDQQGVLTLTLRLRSARGAGGGYYALSVPLREGQELQASSVQSRRVAKIRRMSQNFLKTLQFDKLLDGDAAAASVPSSIKKAAAGSQRVLLIATEAGPSYSLEYGASVNNQIAAVIDAANVIYIRDIATRLSISRQIARTAASEGSTSADTLLDNFASGNVATHYLGAADIFHYFSARDFDGFTVGLAYVGTACQYFSDGESYAYGISQDFNPSINHLVVAHEIGHNIGAEHDSATSPPSLMYPSASGDQNYLSNVSKSQIAAHFGQYGASCLGGSEVPGSSPTPSASGSPSPSASVDPTPQPTVPENNGGTGGGFNPDGTPTLLLNARLNRSGNFNLQFSLGYAVDNCTLELQGAKDRGFELSLGAAFSALFSGSNIEIGSTVTRSAKKDRTGKAPIYLRARFTCPNLPVFTSEVVRVNAAVVRSSSSALGARGWVRALGKSVVDAFNNGQ